MSEQKENTIKNVLTVRYKSPEFLVFHYRDLQDLENLIKFVGKTPQINADMTLKYKKQIIKNDTYVFRNEYGDVTKIVTKDELKLGYDCSPLSEFTESHVNQIQDRVKK